MSQTVSKELRDEIRQEVMTKRGRRRRAPQAIEDKRLLSVDDVMRILHAGRDTIYKMLESGEIYGFRLDGCRWIIPAEPFYRDVLHESPKNTIDCHALAKIAAREAVAALADALKEALGN